MAGEGTVLVPKGPRAQKPNVEQLRAQLFALPLPPGRAPIGRPFRAHTTLGRIMRLRGLSVNEVSKIPGGPSYHQISQALAETRLLNPDHKNVLAVALGIDRRLLD